MHTETATSRSWRVRLVLLVVGPLLAACAHDYALEDMEVPVHVWLRAPLLAETGGSVDALIYVDARKVVQGPVSVPQGARFVELPTVYVPAGSRTVSVVLRGGAVSASESVDIDGECWIEIVLAGGGVSIDVEDRQPEP